MALADGTAQGKVFPSGCPCRLRRVKYGASMVQKENGMGPEESGEFHVCIVWAPGTHSANKTLMSPPRATTGRDDRHTGGAGDTPGRGRVPALRPLCLSSLGCRGAKSHHLCCVQTKVIPARGPLYLVCLLKQEVGLCQGTGRGGHPIIPPPTPQAGAHSPFGHPSPQPTSGSTEQGAGRAQTPARAGR